MSELPASAALFPLAPPSAIWRAAALRGVYRLLLVVVAGGLPFYSSPGAKIEGAVRLIIFVAGALLAGDPRRLYAWAVVLCTALVQIAISSFIAYGPAPGPSVALASAVLLSIVFCGARTGALFFAAALALVFGCSELIQAHLVPVPIAYSFTTAGIWVRSGGNVLFVTLAVAYTVEGLLLQFERGLRERGEAIVRLRSEQAGRAAAEGQRDTAAAALAQAEKHQLVGQLTAGVAHDFNNILVVILSCADVLRDPEAREAERTEAAGAIVKVSERATALARELVSLGRAEAGRRERIDLEELGTELVRTLQRMLAAPIEVRAGRLEPAPVTGVPAQLHQVLLNFAFNARDAMPGGGSITVSSGPATERERGDLLAPCAAVRVTDTGSGIDDATKARLFEPFFSTKGRGQGLGLGLASAQAIAQSLGGRIHVESTAGAGSTFALVLPVAPDEPAQAAPQERAVSVAGHRILLVEDEAPVRSVMARVLRKNGMEVLEAADGASAIGLIHASGKVDLLCVDGILPDMLSQRVIDEVLARYPKTPVLVCSGHVDAEALRARIAEGRYAFLAKPFGGATLIETVTSLL